MIIALFPDVYFVVVLSLDTHKRHGTLIIHRIDVVTYPIDPIKGKNKTTRASFFSYKNILWNKMAVRFLWLSVSFVPECQSASCIENNSSQLSDEAHEIDDGSLSVTLSKTKQNKKDSN